jgi:hypothetical protein
MFSGRAPELYSGLRRPNPSLAAPAESALRDAADRTQTPSTATKAMLGVASVPA